jgi:hypothetical protein
MITVKVHWGTTVTEVTHAGGRFAAWIGDVARQLDEGRRSGSATIHGTQGTTEIPYAQIRRVEMTWSPS